MDKQAAKSSHSFRETALGIEFGPHVSKPF